MSKQNETPTIPAPPPEDVDDNSPTIPMKRSELEIWKTICAKGVTR